MRMQTATDNPSRTEPLFYSIARTAQLLSTSTTTIRRMIRDGQIPVKVIGHGKVRQRKLIPRAFVHGLAELGN